MGSIGEWLQKRKTTSISQRQPQRRQIQLEADDLQLSALLRTKLSRAGQCSDRVRARAESHVPDAQGGACDLQLLRQARLLDVQRSRFLPRADRRMHDLTVTDVTHG